LAGYAEGIIFFNFAADALLLFVTGKLSGRPLQLSRLLAASLAGTIPVVLYLAAGSAGFLHKSLTVIMPVLMVRIAFKITGITSLISMVLTFYFIVFLTCGINWTGQGLIDTGNALCDPISQKEVAICQIHSYEQWPDVLFKEDISDLLHLPDNWTEKLVWIPSKSIHTESKLLASFRTDSFTVWIDGKEKKTDRALVTFTDKVLSDDESFVCILHPNMVRE
jgi:hypothetical protein